MKKRMNIAISINEKYIPYAYVMLTSLFENNKEEQVCVYILYGEKKDQMQYAFDGLAEKYRQSIYYLPVNQEVFGNKLPHNDEWTMEIYHRLALAEVLPDEADRILYLDADIIVLAGLGEFYNMDMQGKSLAACKDMGVLHGTGPLSPKQEALFDAILEDGKYAYFNSGVLLMDIAKMRREDKNTDFFVKTGEAIADNIYGDQDILNYVYYDDVVYADVEKYNIFARLSYNIGRGYEWVREQGTIVHFVGRKPWQHNAIRYNTEKLFWDYAKMTPYYTELLEQVILGEVESCFIDSTIKRLEKEKVQLNDTVQKCMEFLKKIR